MCVTAVRVERVRRLPHGAKMMVDQAPHGPVVIWIDESVSPEQADIWAEQALREFSGPDS